MYNITFNQYRSWQFIIAFLFIILIFNSAVLAQQTAPAKSKDYQATVKLNPIDNSIAEDTAITEMIGPYSTSMKEKMNLVIGYAPELINKEGAGAGRLGMFITDILRQQATKTAGEKIELAFQNNGGIRAEIPAGEITVGTIFRLMPFENRLAVIEMKGDDLLALFQSMASNIKDFGAAISGAELLFNDQGFVSAKIDDQPLDTNATYRMVLSDYLYNGGGEYPILRRGKNYRDLGITIRDAIIDYVRAEEKAGHKIVAPSQPRVRVEKPLSKNEKDEK